MIPTSLQPLPSQLCQPTEIMQCHVIDRSDIIPPFLKLLRDTEAEVRVAAASKVACICNILEAETVRCDSDSVPI